MAFLSVDMAVQTIAFIWILLIIAMHGVHIIKSNYLKDIMPSVLYSNDALGCEIPICASEKTDVSYLPFRTGKDGKKMIYKGGIIKSTSDSITNLKP